MPHVLPVQSTRGAGSSSPTSGSGRVLDRRAGGALRRRLGAAVLLYLVNGLQPLAASDATELISVQTGTLPMVLTAPHDGEQRPGNAPVRRSGERVRDLHTAHIVMQTALRLEERLGEKPWVVIARFSRRYADANRPAQDGVESPDALPAWQAYHDAIARAIAAIRAQHGQGLLMDVHGQAQANDTLFIGTRNGLTVRPLILARGRDVLLGPTGLAGLFGARGYKVIPAAPGAVNQALPRTGPTTRAAPRAATPADIRDTQREDRRYEGGYTVAHYGSHRPGGLHAIQLAFGLRLREDSLLPVDLADVLIDFMRAQQLLR